MASSVVKRTAFALPVLRMDRLAIVIPTCSDSSDLLTPGPYGGRCGPIGLGTSGLPVRLLGRYALVPFSGIFAQMLS